MKEEGCSCATQLKESFFAILGDVVDLDFIFGEEGMGGASGTNNFLLSPASIFPVVRGLFLAEYLRI